MRRWPGVLLVVGAAAACSSQPADPFVECTVPLLDFVDGGSQRSEIPALFNPAVAQRGDPTILYVGLNDRVIGFEFNGLPVAVPYPLLWWHEVVNMEVPGEAVTVTYAPLTGSSLVFNPVPAGVDAFRISRFVLHSNLVMEDSTGTLWPQMSRLAGCGPLDGTRLETVEFEDLTLGGWIAMHLDTFIVGRDTGFDFPYTLYPYGDYRQNDARFVFPTESLDTRRPAKELVVGARYEGVTRAWSLPGLDALATPDDGFISLLNEQVAGRPVVLFYNGLTRSARLYEASAEGQRLTFDVIDGQRVDRETGSVWQFTGRAAAGPLAGTRLTRVEDIAVAYWFAWSEFEPETEVWQPAAALNSTISTSLLPRDDSFFENPPPNLLRDLGRTP